MAVPPRIPWRSLGTLAAAVGASVAVALWVADAGGPAGVRARYGLLAPLVSWPLHVVTTLTPVGEVLPFGVANGTLYGLVPGAVLNWTAWMAAAVVQYRFGRRAHAEAGRLPRWMARLPIAHPLVLACARWLPGGGPLVDAAAGAAGVPFRRAMTWAAIGHAPQAVAIAAVGAGLVRWL